MMNTKNIRLIMTGIIAAMLMAVSLPFISFADEESAEADKVSIETTLPAGSESAPAEIGVTETVVSEVVVTETTEIAEETSETVEETTEGAEETTETVEETTEGTEETTETVEETTEETEETTETVEGTTEDAEETTETAEEAAEVALGMETANLLAAAQLSSAPEIAPWRWNIKGSDYDYASLYEVLQHANDGDTIRTIQPVIAGTNIIIKQEAPLHSGGIDTPDIVIDKNNLTIDFTNCSAVDIGDDTSGNRRTLIKIADGVSKCTIKNGIIDARYTQMERTYAIQNGFFFEGYGGTTLTLQNMVFDGMWSHGIADGPLGENPTGNFFNINMSDSIYNSGANDFCLIGYGVNCVVDNSDLNFSKPCCSDKHGFSKVSFNNCTINAAYPGLNTIYGTASVTYSDCILSITGPTEDIKSYNKYSAGPGKYSFNKDYENIFIPNINTELYKYSREEDGNYVNYIVEIKREGAGWRINDGIKIYESLYEAVNAAKAGDTIKARKSNDSVVLHSKDHINDYIVISKDGLTIDFDGCTSMEINNATSAVKYLFEIPSNAPKCRLEIKNGTINTDLYTAIIHLFDGNPGDTLILQSMNFEGNTMRALAADFDNKRPNEKYFNVQMFDSSYYLKADGTHPEAEEVLVYERVNFIADNSNICYMFPTLYLAESDKSATYFRNCNIYAKYLGATTGETFIEYYNCDCIIGCGNVFKGNQVIGPGVYSVNPTKYINQDKYTVEKTTQESKTVYQVKLKEAAFDLATERNGHTYYTTFGYLDDAFNHVFPGDSTSIELYGDAGLYDTVYLNRREETDPLERQTYTIDLKGHNINVKNSNSSFVIVDDSNLIIKDSEYINHLGQKSVIDGSAGNNISNMFEIQDGNLAIANVDIISGKNTENVILSNSSKQTEILFENVNVTIVAGITDYEKSLLSSAGTGSTSWTIEGSNNVYRGFDNLVKEHDGNYTVYLNDGIFYTDFRNSPSYNQDKIVISPACTIIEGIDEFGDHYIQVFNNKLSYGIYDSNGNFLGQLSTLKLALQGVPVDGTIKLLANQDESTDRSLGDIIVIDKPIVLDLNHHSFRLILDDRISDVVFIQTNSKLSIINGTLTIGYHNDKFSPNSICFIKSNADTPSSLLIKNLRLTYEKANYPVSFSSVIESGNFDSVLFSGTIFSGFTAIEHGSSDSVGDRTSRYIGVSFDTDLSEKVDCLISNESGHSNYNTVIYSGDYSRLGSLTKNNSGSLRILGGKFASYSSGRLPKNYLDSSNYAISMSNNEVVTGNAPQIRILLAANPAFPDGQEILIQSIKTGTPEQSIFDEYIKALSDGDTLSFIGSNKDINIRMVFDGLNNNLYRGTYYVDMNGHGTTASADNGITVSGPGIIVRVSDSQWQDMKAISGNGDAIMIAKNKAKLYLNELILTAPGKTAVRAESDAEIYVNNIIFQGCGIDIATSVPETGTDESRVYVDGMLSRFGFASAEGGEIFFSGRAHSVKIEDGTFATPLTTEEAKVAYFNENYGLVKSKDKRGITTYLVRRDGNFVNPTDDLIRNSIVIKDVTGNTEGTGTVTNTETTKTVSGSSKKGSGGGGGSGSGGGGGSGSGGGGSAGGPADKAPLAAAPAAQGTSSPNWFTSADGTWKIKNSAGQVVTNAWVCDDVVAANGQNVWYMVGPTGAMVTAGLVRDLSGKLYALETDKNSPYYGMLRYKNGYYNCNGQQVYLEFSQAHDGTFGTVINPEGIAALQAIYGITDFGVSNTQSVHTATF